MTVAWGPPANKTALVKVLRTHTAAFCAFGYRPTEIRLNETLHRLWVSGTKVPQITGPTGLNIKVNVDFRFYKSIEWDYIEYLAIRPSGSDRVQRTSTFLAPPAFGFVAADAYSRLRRKRISAQAAFEAAVPLAEMAGERDIDPWIVMFSDVHGSFDSPAEAVAHLGRLTA